MFVEIIFILGFIYLLISDRRNTLRALLTWIVSWVLAFIVIIVACTLLFNPLDTYDVDKISTFGYQVLPWVAFVVAFFFERIGSFN